MDDLSGFNWYCFYCATFYRLWLLVMKLKTNLHLHTADDPKDRIHYTIYEAIDEAKRLDFDVLALTCHGFFATRPEHIKYAKQKGILLIPGIELAIEGSSPLHGRHVVVLNCTKEIETVRTFADLSEYRINHPEIFIIAPHPYYPHPLESCSLKEQLVPNIDLFDAIEFSWYYSKIYNRYNRKAEKVAIKHRLPYVATSDTHFMEYLDTSYAMIETVEKTPEAIFEAIRARNFYNVSFPRKFFSEMIWGYLVRKVIFGDLIMGGSKNSKG